MTAFILQNQYGQFLNKDNEWVSGSDARTLFRSPHHDVALNQLIEVNAKDYSLRGAVVACELDSKGLPLVTTTETINQVQEDPAGETGSEPVYSPDTELLSDDPGTESNSPTFNSDALQEDEAVTESEVTAAHA